MNELSLFSGAGGGLLGTKLLGWRAVGYVEREPYCQAILEARIRDGLLDPAPIFGDVRAFLRSGDCDRFAGRVDVVTAGFPCQPFSVAGKRLAGDDDRNLWPETAEVLRRVRPRFALLENVPGLASHEYFGRVLGDLAALGFDAEWTVLGADDAGAPHRRKRLWILAYFVDAKSRRAQGGGGKDDPLGNSSSRNGTISGLLVRPWPREPRGTGWRGGGREVADAEILGRGEGRPEPARLEGRPRPAGSGSDVADAAGSRPAHLHEDEAGGPESRGDAAHGGGRGEDVAYAECDGYERSEPARPAPNLRRRSPDEGLAPVAHALEPGLEGHPGDGPDWDEPGREREGARGPARAGRVREEVAHADPERRPECRLSEGEGREGLPDPTGSGRVGPDPGGRDPGGEDVADAFGGERDRRADEPGRREERRAPASWCGEGGWWSRDPADEGPESESFVGRVAHGVAHRVDRLRAIGNGQVPAVVVLAWHELYGRIHQPPPPVREHNRKGAGLERRTQQSGPEQAPGAGRGLIP